MSTVCLQQHEEVLLISRSGNYSNYSSSSSVINTASLIIDHGPAKAGSTLSIAGGVVYQGSADPALRGRYLYMYAFAPWTAVESPVSSGHYTSVSVPNIRCSLSTPVPCLASGGIGGRVVSFGEDNSKDAFVLATGGVYRVVWPGLCGGFDGAVYQPVQPAADYTLLWFIVLPFTSFLVLYHLYMMIKKMNPCGGQTATHNWECFRCCGNVNCCSDVTNNSY